MVSSWSMTVIVQEISNLYALLKNQQVVLGLITSKSGELENRDEIIARIKEAAQYVDINQLCLSPQLWFASTEEGNILTEEQQWKKLEFYP